MIVCALHDMLVELLDNTWLFLCAMNPLSMSVSPCDQSAMQKYPVLPVWLHVNKPLTSISIEHTYLASSSGQKGVMHKSRHDLGGCMQIRGG